MLLLLATAHETAAAGGCVAGANLCGGASGSRGSVCGRRHGERRVTTAFAERADTRARVDADRDLRPGLTVLVPAYNEAESIADTVKSLQAQTLPPDEIIVIDDCSTDATAEIAAALGVTVLQPSRNTGSKAGAQNVALTQVTTAHTMAVDADTVLEPDAIEKLMVALDDESVAAACGFVIPRNVRTPWERGRYVEYLYAFTFCKVTQDYYGKPLISSGCFSAYRTDVLLDVGGWSTRTMAEDMDLTWTLYQRGWNVRFVPDAVCYPVEPHNREFMGKQLRRWSHGFVQNVRLHWRGILDVGVLRSMVAVAMWDAVIASFATFLLIPALAILVDPRFLFFYIVDAPAILVPAIVTGVRRREVGRVLASYPGYVLLRFYNAWHIMRALWLELVMRRPLLVYEKGH
jgi:poly-beta-1,6-N-acetyl-D-glucosamine synthase